MSTQAQIAEHLDLSERRVRDLIQDGIIPAGKGRGGLILDDCRVAYIRHLRGIASGQVKTDDEELELSQERAKLAIQQERKLKRENDIAESLVAPLSFLQGALEKIANQVVPILETIPLNMKRMNPKLTGHDIQIVKKAIAQSRNIIADIRIDLDE